MVCTAVLAEEFDADVNDEECEVFMPILFVVVKEVELDPVW